MKIGKIQIDSPKWGYAFILDCSLGEGYAAVRFRYRWIRVSWKPIVPQGRARHFKI